MIAGGSPRTRRRSSWASIIFHLNINVKGNVLPFVPVDYYFITCLTFFLKIFKHEVNSRLVLVKKLLEYHYCKG